MHTVLIVAVVIAGWCLVSLFLAVAIGRAIAIAEKPVPKVQAPGPFHRMPRAA